MLYPYYQYIEIFGIDRKLKKTLANEQIFKIEKGIYPDLYFLATSKEIKKIRDKRVKQNFENSKVLYLGAIKMNYNNVEIKIYSKERMLIELIRSKNNLQFYYST